MNNLKLSILSEERKKIIPHFVAWKDKFYLAGGTALALQIGHREIGILAFRWSQARI